MYALSCLSCFRGFFRSSSSFSESTYSFDDADSISTAHEPLVQHAGSDYGTREVYDFLQLPRQELESCLTDFKEQPINEPVSDNYTKDIKILVKTYAATNETNHCFEGKLGSGGFATVFKVHSNSLKESFALKVLKTKKIKKNTVEKHTKQLEWSCDFIIKLYAFIFTTDSLATYMEAAWTSAYIFFQGACTLE